jgi:hypothetical protein
MDSGELVDKPIEGYHIVELNYLLNWAVNFHRTCPVDLKVELSTKRGFKQRVKLTCEKYHC